MRLADLLLVLLLGLSLTGAFGFIWQLLNTRGAARRGKAGPRERRRDQEKKSLAHKRARRVAQDLLSRGLVAQAAEILEKADLLRECVTVLEAKGMIEEAARALMRAKRVERAGFFLAQHGKWEAAAEVFKKIRRPIEAAKAYREAGAHDKAAQMFESAERDFEAGEEWMTAKGYARATEAFFRAGRATDAIAALVQHVKTGEFRTEPLNLGQDSQEKVVAYQLFHPDDRTLFPVLADKPFILPMLAGLLRQGHVASAAALYQQRRWDCLPDLLRQMRQGDVTSEGMAQLLLAVSDYTNAGMILERAKEFLRAGRAYEQGEDWERAERCYTEARADKDLLRIRDRLIERVEPRAQQILDESPTLARQQEDTVPIGTAAPPTHDLTVVLDSAPMGSDAISSEDARLIFHGARLWEGLDHEQKERLWHLCRRESATRDERMVEYQDEPKGIYVILGGVVSVLAREAHGEREIAALGRGDCMGHAWIFAHMRADHRVVAASPLVQYLLIPKDLWIQTVDQDGRLGRLVYEHYTQHLAHEGPSTSAKVA